MSFQVANAQFYDIEKEIIDESDEPETDEIYLDYTTRDQKDKNSNFLNEKIIETNNIDKKIKDIYIEDYVNSFDYSNQPIICFDSGLVIDNYENCPSPCINGYFVMPGIECNDVGNPIQCEGTEIVVTDPRDCPQKCIGGYFDGFYVREEPECKINPDKEDFNFQSCTTRLIVDDLSYCPVKCVTGPFNGLYVMDARECNWPKPNIKICDNGFVVDNFIANCPIKCNNGEFDGFYVMDVKECNTNIQTSTPSISSFSSLNSFSNPSLFNPYLVEKNDVEFMNEKFMKENDKRNKDKNDKDLKFMKENDKRNKDNTSTINKKLMKHKIPEIKDNRSNQCNNCLIKEIEKVNLFGFGLKF